MSGLQSFHLTMTETRVLLDHRDGELFERKSARLNKRSARVLKAIGLIEQVDNRYRLTETGIILAGIIDGCLAEKAVLRMAGS